MTENYINNNFNLTLATAVNNTNTTLIVSSAVTVDGGFRILIESELLSVTSGGLTTSWTVVRGIEGTTGNAHGATVSINIVLTAGALQKLPASPNAMDDEFNGTTLSGIWTLSSPFGGTVSGGRLNFAGIPNYYLTQPRPTAPYEFTIEETYFQYTISGNPLVGFMVTDSAGKSVIWCAGCISSNWVLQQVWFTAGLIYNSTQHANGTIQLTGKYYCKLKDDGSNFTWSFSQDGINFLTVYSTSTTEFLGSGGSIGLAALSGPVAVSFDFFRRTL